MTRVCLVTRQFWPETVPGGIATYTRLLADGLAASGNEVAVLSHTSGRTVSRECRGEIVIWRLPDVGRSAAVPSALGRPLAVRHFLMNHDHAFDVVEYPSWAGEGALVPRSAASVLAVRLITTLHTVARFRTMSARERLISPLVRTLESSAIHNASLRMSGSTSHADAVAGEFRVPRSSIKVLPFGIPIPPSRPLPKDAVVLIVGRLEPRKGSEIALAAARLVLSSMPDVRFVFAGDIGRDSRGTPYQDLVARDDKLRGSVQLLGRIDDAALELLRMRSRLILVPSLSESFGLTYLEALAAGRPLIAFDIPSARELLGGTGVPLTEPTPDALADAIRHLLADEKASRRLGEFGREFVRQTYTTDRMVGSTLAAYRAALARSA